MRRTPSSAVTLTMKSMTKPANRLPFMHAAMTTTSVCQLAMTKFLPAVAMTPLTQAPVAISLLESMAATISTLEKAMT